MPFIKLNYNQKLVLRMTSKFGIQCGPLTLYNVIVEGEHRLLCATADVARLIEWAPLNVDFAILRTECDRCNPRPPKSATPILELNPGQVDILRRAIENLAAAAEILEPQEVR
jgi:hypothetical protein